MTEIVRLSCDYRVNPLGIGDKNPEFSWNLKSDGSNVMQKSYRVQTCGAAGDFSRPLWDSGEIQSGDCTHIAYGGPALASMTRYRFRVKITTAGGEESPWSETAFFETGILDSRLWRAEFITADETEKSYDSASPLLRREFTVPGEIARARVYATAFGLYELSVNGSRVGDSYLTPGWTSYRKRVQHQTYDVTGLLKKGANAVGAMLGNGWYKGYLAGWTADNVEKYGKRTALLFELHITLTDGTEQVLVSDESWKASSGPILESELYNGETYDARLEAPGWDQAGFDDSAWGRVYRLEADKSVVLPQENIPVQKIQTVRPVALIRTPRGETVLDMGQNMVGWMKFRVSGPRGSRVALRHAEVLDKDGNFYTENLRKARQAVTYTLKGEGTECFEPHFTYQGFRYVCVDEYPGEVRLPDFEGVVLHSGMKRTGRFTCSDPMINQLAENIVWGQKGNFVDVPTDCPQRDERLGWTGDAQAFAGAACFLMDTALFYKKWLRDLAADQRPDGGVPHVIPQVLGPNDHSSSGWGDAAVIVPWTVYLLFGDKRVLAEQYGSMKAWVEYIRSHAENGRLWNTGDHFGDWLALDAKEGSYRGATPNDLVSTAFYAYSASLLSRAAGVLGSEADEKAYAALYDDIREAFRNEYITPSGRIVSNTQTAHVLALQFGLVREKDRARTVASLVDLIEENDGHLTTGFLGTPYLCHVLSENGRADVAYSLLLKTDYPSWLYPVTKGATTVWEHWDGIRPDGSFWSSDMNSFNHYAYGAIGDWLFEVVAGINADKAQPGFRHIVLTPHPDSRLGFAAAEYDSILGRVASGWSLENNVLTVEVTVPHNAAATLTLPGAAGCEIRESGPSEGIRKSPAAQDGSLSVELGSGSYSFAYAYRS